MVVVLGVVAAPLAVLTSRSNDAGPSGHFFRRRRRGRRQRATVRVDVEDCLPSRPIQPAARRCSHPCAGNAEMTPQGELRRSMLMKMKTGQSLGALTSVFSVELPGIEPGSYGIPSRLLRAQFAMPLLGSPVHAN